MNEIDTLLRTAAVSGISPRDGDIHAVVVRGTALERARAHRAVRAAARRIRDRQLVPDGVGFDEEVAAEIETTASALSGLVRPVVSSS
jgi:hypothetical protein